MKRFIYLTFTLLAACSCNWLDGPGSPREEPVPEELTLPGLARMFSKLPIDEEHLGEVYRAVHSSSSNGYDEEYTMACLFSSPGAGVGEKRTADTKAGATEAAGVGNRNAAGVVAKGADSTRPGMAKGADGTRPLRDLIREYLSERPVSKGSVESLMAALEQSDYQLYWPYSENWDGRTFPIITFDPGYGAESNYGFQIGIDELGVRIVDSVYVDEAVAMRHPVWVLNSNSDAAFTPVELFESVPGVSVLTRSADAEPTASPAGNGTCATTETPAPASRPRKLLLKTFKMLRNYDSWFCGASEFWIKCGSVEGFKASTEAELKLYSPSLSEFMIIVKRYNLGKVLPFESILVTDFSTQLDKLAFLITEDDGGPRTNWKCEAAVKIQSKTYGISIDIPLNVKDDIVWRGQLSARFFEEEDIVTGRFGDVVLSFELD